MVVFSSNASRSTRTARLIRIFGGDAAGQAPRKREADRHAGQSSSWSRKSNSWRRTGPTWRSSPGTAIPSIGGIIRLQRRTSGCIARRAVIASAGLSPRDVESQWQRKTDSRSGSITLDAARAADPRHAFAHAAKAFAELIRLRGEPAPIVFHGEVQVRSVVTEAQPDFGGAGVFN